MKNLLALLLLTTCFAGLSGQEEANSERPHIVFIIADDIGWDDLSCYGHPTISTPNIDKIAQEGIRFDQMFLTASSCSPSRCSFISGRYPHNTGAAELHTPLPDNIPTIASVLKDVGYYCVQAGKWHMGESAKSSFDQVILEGNGVGGEEQWVKCLQDRAKDQPLFAWLAAFDAHRAWQAHDLQPPFDPDKVHVPPYLVDEEETRKDLAKYYDEIIRFDHYVGEVERELERQGILDNTLLIITSDNGSPFPRCKTRVYDSGMKTPFIVKWNQGISTPGSFTESLVSIIDMAPTLVELAEGELPESFQGKSFHTLFDQPSLPFRSYVFAEHNWHDFEAFERMVRTPDFMYVLNLRAQFMNQGPADAINSASFQDLLARKGAGELTQAQVDIFMHPRPREELFDCRMDPLQLNNLASRNDYQEELASLRNIMKEWREVTGDALPEKLSKDQFDRLTGDRLMEMVDRGEMPGSSDNAISITASGPF